MSTDYGYRCMDCNTDSIVENARYYDIADLRSFLQPKVLEAIKIIRSVGLDTMVDRGWYCFPAALTFAIEHIDMGHNVVVANEYGEMWKGDE